MVERLGLAQDDVQLLSSVALVLLTFALVVATFMYARDTRRMVEEIRKQNRPYVYLSFEEDTRAGNHQLLLRNTGNRVAQDITVAVRQDALIVQMHPDESVRDEVMWKKVAVPVSSVQICKKGVQSLAPGEVMRLGFTEWYRARMEDQHLTYDVKYSDGAGVQYRESLSLAYWICPP